MKQPAKIKCNCCQAAYEDDPLRAKQWWSGRNMTETVCDRRYEVMPFNEDIKEHLCGILCLQRRIAQVVKPESKG